MSTDTLWIIQFKGGRWIERELPERGARREAPLALRDDETPNDAIWRRRNELTQAGWVERSFLAPGVMEDELTRSRLMRTRVDLKARG